MPSINMDNKVFINHIAIKIHKMKIKNIKKMMKIKRIKKNRMRITINKMKIKKNKKIKIIL
jgi:hypothetical protein